jgi:myo-inositol-1(or 4)-monophosphatase
MAAGGRSAHIHVMIEAAEKAGRSLIRDFGEVEQLQVSKKGPGDFVSKADLKSEKILKEELLKARPTYGFLLEEQGEVKGTEETYRWVIDPLDGTTNFLHGLPHWAVVIALEKNNGKDREIVAAVIHDPIKNETFYAEKGAGAFGTKR